MNDVVSDAESGLTASHGMVANLLSRGVIYGTTFDLAVVMFTICVV